MKSITTLPAIHTKESFAPHKLGITAKVCLLFFICAFSSTTVIAAPTVAAPIVAASIRPLQLIAAAITDGISQPQLVLGKGQDPHHASLRPSERRTLNDADVVLWIGPILEVPLQEIMAELAGSVLTVQDMPDITLHAIDGNLDPHVWMDSRNARQIALQLMQTLVNLDPANSLRYQSNQQKFLRALDELDTNFKQAVAPVQQRGWAVYHDAFRYFQLQFGLIQPLAPTESSTNQAGIRSITQLRSAIQQQQINCLLIEAVMNPAELQTLLGTDGLHIVSADVMGLDLTTSPAAYVLLLQNFGNTLITCLQGQP